mgnify:CR=1 FL=1
MYYINCFFIYSFIGYFFESFLSILKKEKIGSGILYGPWTPIYGVGGVLIILISNFIFSFFKIENWIETIICIIVITIILTFVEWVGGKLIEKIFHVTFWDYRRFKFNIGKYIALEVSFVWTLGSLLVIYVLQPLINKFIYFIPNYITYILLFAMIVDYVVLFKKGKIHK